MTAEAGAAETVAVKAAAAERVGAAAEVKEVAMAVVAGHWQWRQFSGRCGLAGGGPWFARFSRLFADPPAR